MAHWSWFTVAQIGAALPRSVLHCLVVTALHISSRYLICAKLIRIDVWQNITFNSLKGNYTGMSESFNCFPLAPENEFGPCVTPSRCTKRYLSGNLFVCSKHRKQ